jgi:hypothetical protein
LKSGLFGQCGGEAYRRCFRLQTYVDWDKSSVHPRFFSTNSIKTKTVCAAVICLCKPCRPAPDVAEVARLVSLIIAHYLFL